MTGPGSVALQKDPAGTGLAADPVAEEAAAQESADEGWGGEALEAVGAEVEFARAAA